MSSKGGQKARYSLRLKEAVGKKKSKSRSEDLVALTEQFNVLKARLGQLTGALRAHHSAMGVFAKSRFEVAKAVSAMGNRSPISDITGRISGEDGASEAASGDPNNYAAVHAAVSSRHSMYADRYQKFVVDYAIEWEKVVVARVSAGLKKAEVLRIDLDHYSAKVEGLRQTANVKMAKGKIVDPKESEKLKRNEEKLMNSRREYELFASDLCSLIEEVTERSWKDLHPLLVKLTQFDSTLGGEEAKNFARLDAITDTLKQIATKHGLKPQARLKEIESQSASVFSSKDSALSIEYDGPQSLSGSNHGDAIGGGGLLSPNSAGGDTSFGSPRASGWAEDSLAASQSGTIPAGREASFSSNMSTSEMLSLAGSAAPPPTMDMVNESTSALSLGGSNIGSTLGGSNIGITLGGSNIGSGLPPLLPTGARHPSRSLSAPMESSFGGGSAMGVGGMESSFGGGSALGVEASFGSTYSASAPAPAAPPPPPPPPLSMYSGIGSAPASGNSVASGGSYHSSAPPSLELAMSQNQTNPWSVGASSSPSPRHHPQSTSPFGAPGVAGNGTNPFGSSPMGGVAGGSGTNPFE